jgi:hypothetical protein
MNKFMAKTRSSLMPISANEQSSNYFNFINADATSFPIMPIIYFYPTSTTPFAPLLSNVCAIAAPRTSK